MNKQERDVDCGGKVIAFKLYKFAGWIEVKVETRDFFQAMLTYSTLRAYLSKTPPNSIGGDQS